MAADRATKGKTPPEFIAKGALRAAWLARIMRLVQTALAIVAALGLRHGGEVNVDEKEECKKLGGLKNDLAHCEGLLFW